MVNLDLKDRKILYQLDLNCRQSNAQIGKKVGLSKQVVDYRIKRMEEEGIITGYWTNIDSYKLGYDVYRYYIKFQNINPDIEKEIIKHFIDYKNSWAVNSKTGIYDMSLVIWVKNVPEFYKFWDETNDKFGDFFTEKIFSLYVQAYVYKKDYLINDNIEKRKYFYIVGLGEKADIDFIDYKILNLLSENAKIPLIDLSEKIKCSSQNIIYRIKNLEKKLLILAYRININHSKLGLQHFKVDIWLREASKRKKIWEYIQNIPNVIFINTSAGYADIEIEFNIENISRLIEIIEDLNLKFPNVIRKYIYHSTKKFHKLRCLPEMTETDFKKT